jgi:hypothetical protein
LASTDYTGIHALASATVSNVDPQSGSLQMSAYGRIIDNLEITDPNIAYLPGHQYRRHGDFQWFSNAGFVISFGFNYGGSSPVPIEQSAPATVAPARIMSPTPYRWQCGMRIRTL